MKTFKIVILLLFFFYYVFPQGLNIGGSSFILFSGITGLVVYIWHKFPFAELFKMILALLGLIFIYYSCMFINGTYYDPYAFGYVKSNVAFIFTAYLLIFLMFNIHKTPTFHTLLYYLVATVVLQCIITLVMYFSDGVKDFLISIQLQTDITERAVDIAEKERLVGYGTGFFGAGSICGFGLIIMGYLFMKAELKTKQFLLLAVLYSFVFYIGLFMARTTIIGLAFSLMLIAFLFLFDKKSNKKNFKTFLISFVFLAIAGYFLAFAYFPSFTGWAFELFNNFVSTGELQTQSSSGLSEMFYLPEDLKTFFFGTGSMEFFGSDVGYTRLFFYAGIFGTIMFFLYSMIIVRLSYTKDWSVNIVGITIIVYVMILNIKGLIDQNPALYVIFFYFMFYKYYIFMPKVYANAKLMSMEKLTEGQKTNPI